MTSHTQSPKPPTACRVGFYCERCRADSDKGQERRDRLIAKPLAGLNLGPRFACPFGRGEVGAYIPPPKSKGVGDTVAKVTHALGIEQCPPCKERQADWNALLPYNQDDLTPQGK